MFYAGIKIFNILPPIVIILKDDKAKFKAPLGKYLHTHSIYSVDEFLCVKIIYNTVFVKCLVFYIVNLYIYVRMYVSMYVCSQ